MDAKLKDNKGDHEQGNNDSMDDNRQNIKGHAESVVLKESSKIIIAVMIGFLMLVAIVLFGLRCGRKKSAPGSTLV